MINFTHLSNTVSTQTYYEIEAASRRSKADQGLEKYYELCGPALWVSRTGEMVEDGRPVRPGEIAAALGGRAPKPFRSREMGIDREAQREIATNVGAPDRRAAMDITFSDPKSYSALVRCAELAGMTDLVAELRRQRTASLRAVLQHAAEIGLVATRRGKGGTSFEAPRDFMAALVPHSLTRYGDVDEHHHGLVFNGGLRHDSSVGTLDLSNLVTNKFYLQAVAGSDHAARLRHMGFATVGKPGLAGQWELAGTPDALIATWSKGTAKIAASLPGIAGELARQQAKEAKAQGTRREFDEDGYAIPTLGRSATRAKREAKQRAALAQRRPKDSLPDAAGLEARHRQEVADLGLSPAKVVAGMRQAGVTTQVAPGRAAEAGLSGLFKRHSVVTLRRVRTAIAEAAVPRGLTVTEIDGEIQRAFRDGLVKIIGTNARGEPMVSTERAISTEREMLVTALAGRGRGRLSQDLVASSIAEMEQERRSTGNRSFALAAEQVAFVNWFARGDSVVVGEGLAGAGKTTAMEAVVRVAAAQGVHTIGVAPTRNAAETLKREAGVSEFTSLQALAAGLRDGRRVLTSRDLVIIDEAGMSGLDDVATLVKAACQVGAQIALVGDELQFAAIDPGSPFSALASVLGTSRLEDIRRQRVPWQLDAARKMSVGDSVAGLAAYAAEGRWIFGDDRDAAIARLREDWTKDLERTAGAGGVPATRIVVAARHVEVHAINAALREALVKTGRLGKEEIVVRTLHRDGRNGDVRDLPLRVGEELVIWRNTPQHGLNNGDRITLTGFSRKGEGRSGEVILRWRSEKNGIETEAPLSSLIPQPQPGDPPSLPRVPFLQHAYALTQYAAQGRTVDRAFVFGGTGLDARSSYVALTRHRDDAHVYWDGGGIAARLAEEGQPATRAAVTEHIYREARRSNEKANVLDYVRDVAAWLETGDVHAERPAPSALGARLAAAAENARGTVSAALADNAPRILAAAFPWQGQEGRHRPQPGPRVLPERRAASAYNRESARLHRRTTEAGQRDMARVGEVLAGFARRGGVTGLPAGFSRTAAAPAPTAGVAFRRWDAHRATLGRAEELAKLRAEIDRAGAWNSGLIAGVAKKHAPARMPDRQTWLSAFIERWRGVENPIDGLGRLTGRERLLERVSIPPRPLAARLPDRALTALGVPALLAPGEKALPIPATAYRDALQRERSDQEARIVATVMQRSSVGEAAARQMCTAVLQHGRGTPDPLGKAVLDLRKMTAAYGRVDQAIVAGRLQPDDLLIPHDPRLDDVACRREVGRAMRSAEAHAPRPDPAADRVAFDGTQVTVADLYAMLRARRAALIGPARSEAPPGSAPALLDGGMGTLSEAVRDGRLSAQTMISAVAPSDRAAWTAALRSAMSTRRMANLGGLRQEAARSASRSVALVTMRAHGGPGIPDVPERQPTTGAPRIERNVSSPVADTGQHTVQRRNGGFGRD